MLLTNIYKSRIVKIYILRRRNFMKNNKGFNLIKIFFIILIIAVLVIVMLIIFDPIRRFKDERDARRYTDVETILSAVHQSIVDNKGSLPSNMPGVGTETQLGTAATGCAISTGGCSAAAVACVDLMSGARNLAKYLKTMPIDPSGGSTYDATKTGYTVVVDSNGIVSIKACAQEGGSNISASR
jgi:hypothetical protein